MRLLFLFATGVLLASCMHDQEDHYLAIALAPTLLEHYYEKGTWPAEFRHGASLLKWLRIDAEEKADPWDTIVDSYGGEAVRTGKSKSDPWDTITEKYGQETVHTSRSQRAKVVGTAVDRCGDFVDSIEEGEQVFAGLPISEVVFVKMGRGILPEQTGVLSAGEQVALYLAEVRGTIGRFEDAGGGEVFALGIPGEWEPGVVLRVDAYLLGMKKVLPLLGAVVWTVDCTLMAESHAY